MVLPCGHVRDASRGPIVEEQALISVLKNKQIAGAAIDVFDIEPLPASHPYHSAERVGSLHRRISGFPHC